MHISHLALATLLLGAAAVPGAAQALTPEDGAAYHLRASDGSVQALIDDGVRSSPTFRALVERLTASDVIVYVHAEHNWSSRADGCMTFAAAGGGYRYVVVRIRLLPRRQQMLALLAHELRHAVEVADTPSIVDTASLGRAYGRLGFPSRWAAADRISFDTDAAVAAGYQVLAEIEAPRSQRGRRTLAVNADGRGQFGAGTEMTP